MAGRIPPAATQANEGSHAPAWIALGESARKPSTLDGRWWSRDEASEDPGNVGKGCALDWVYAQGCKATKKESHLGRQTRTSIPVIARPKAKCMPESMQHFKSMIGNQKRW